MKRVLIMAGLSGICSLCSAGEPSGGRGGTAGGAPSVDVKPVTDEVMFTGTVRRVTIEGGFFGVVADDGRKFNATSLAKAYQSDGLRVTVRAKIRRDLKSFRMWGQIIEILEIRKAEPMPQ
jgi:hypothetical protein